MRTPIIGGNWKMNTTAATARALAESIADAVESDGLANKCDVAIFPPFVYLREIAELLRAGNSPVMLGAQDVYFEHDGAYTGEVSITMLKDCGVTIALAGHSERRHVIGESDQIVNRKVRAILDGGLKCILCIGETLAQREAGETDAINRHQLVECLKGVTPEHMTRGGVVIAYEPVWAIGTGKTATPADAQDAHKKIRAALAALYGAPIAGATRIQYGGSANASNIAELLAQPDIDGGLVGGASLKADQFVTVVRTAAAKQAARPTMTPKTFRTLALSLPDTEERSHMDHPDFRVAGKIFATLPDADSKRGMVKLTPAQQRDFMKTNPAAFTAAQGAWGKAGSTYIDLAEIDRKTLRRAILAAWRKSAPKRLIEALGPDDPD